MAETLHGIHHVTSISGDPQQALEFYVSVLGLRLVKTTVNFDLPNTYHFYFGDEVGTPGTILTLFPWPHLPRRPAGTGQIAVTAFAIPPNSIGYWLERLKAHRIDVEQTRTQFDEEVIAFSDHDGLQYELVARDAGPAEALWSSGPVPTCHAIRSFSGVTIWETAALRITALLTDLMGFQHVGEEENRLRFAIGEGPARALIDVVTLPDTPRGAEGVGTVHHIAWRTPDDEEQLAWQERLRTAGFDVTPVRDRQYFKSIYFREPGGVLFEIATDPPGFTRDETVEELGSVLKLPPWLESRRKEIEQGLPPLQRPSPVV